MPSFILIHWTVWPQYTNVTDRQDRTDNSLIANGCPKINAIKIFNAGSIIMTPKRQLLAQKHIIQCIDHWGSSTHFLHSWPYYPNPQILCFAMLFSRPDALRVPLPVAASISSCNTCSLDPSKSVSIPNCISIGSAVFAQLTADSPYTLQCIPTLYNVH